MPNPSPDGRLAARARELSHTLVGWPSVTGTPDEAAFPHRLAALLAENAYFRENPDHLVVSPVPGDPNGRANVFALVAGSGSATVLLSGHFDVVPVDDYGDLAPLAGSPEPLATALIERLRASGLYPQALADLESGAFVPGRGMLDMKSGVAAGIAVLEDFAATPDRSGNLLLIATPDEEENSCGMRAAAAALPAFLEEHGLDARLAVNLDATCDPEDGRNGRVATFGTIGKLLLSAYVVGKDSHACYPFDGVNSAYLAAELAVEFECAQEFAETIGADRAAPPTALALKDHKSVYNVTTPGRSWLFWNVLTLKRSPAEIFETACAMARRVAGRAATRMKERAAAVGQVPSPLWADVEVMTFAEVLDHAKKEPGFEEAYRAEAERLAASGLDLPERSRRLTELAWNATGLDCVAIVLGNASMPYPAVVWSDEGEGRRTAARIEAAMAEIAARENLSIERREFFPAISDMSFLGRQDRAGLAVTAANTPLWGSSIDWNLDAAPAGVPIVNIGPWGRDYHHWLERAHADYTFRVLPMLVRDVALKVLAD